MNFIKSSRANRFESIFGSAYVDLKLDLDKLEKYADEAAEQFEKDKAENGEGFALQNQFKEVKPQKPHYEHKMRKV